MKGRLVGTVLDQPSETQSCVRFTAQFFQHVETEVTVIGDARIEARKVNAGDRIVLDKLALATAHVKRSRTPGLYSCLLGGSV